MGPVPARPRSRPQPHLGATQRALPGGRHRGVSDPGSAQRQLGTGGADRHDDDPGPHWPRGHQRLPISYFFPEGDVPEVRQKPFSPPALHAALTLAITRLQLVELNHSLAAVDPAFRHLNAFETEPLPRIAECLALLDSIKPTDKPLTVHELSRMVELPFEQLSTIIAMDAAALARLIWDSQGAPWNLDFAKTALTCSSGFRQRSWPAKCCCRAIRTSACRRTSSARSASSRSRIRSGSRARSSSARCSRPPTWRTRPSPAPRARIRRSARRPWRSA